PLLSPHSTGSTAPQSLAPRELSAFTHRSGPLACDARDFALLGAFHVSLYPFDLASATPARCTTPRTCEATTDSPQANDGDDDRPTRRFDGTDGLRYHVDS